MQARRPPDPALRMSTRNENPVAHSVFSMAELGVTEVAEPFFGGVEIPGFYEDQADMLRNSEWGNTPLTSWSSAMADNEARLDIQLGLGSGQRRSPFSCSREVFDQAVEDYGFSQHILRRVKEKQSYFEHVFSDGEMPNCLEIAAATYENDAFFCLLRFDLLSGHTRCLLFFKSSDLLKPRTSTLTLSTALNYIRLHDVLYTEPLLIFNVVLSLLQARAHDFLRWRQQLYDIEARIGVSANLNSLRLSHYSDVEYDYSKLNADLTGVARNIADHELSVSTMLEHARSFQRVADICERIRHRSKTTSASPANSGLLTVGITAPQTLGSESGFSLLHEDIQSTITRAEIYLKHIKMTQDVLASLTAALYNRINKSDTRSMKTIAVVTLFFLPSLFVAAIFSTGIFNFQAGEDPSDERVISRYGWVYLMVTLLLTGLTLTVWTVWFFWGEMWLDTLRNKRDRLKSPEPWSADTRRLHAADVNMAGPTVAAGGADLPANYTVPNIGPNHV
jgi:hypothetical protein